MNGAHDLGGWHGFGRIDRSQTEDFIAPWERRVFALTLACGMLGRWNLDQSRAARERMPPEHYLASRYYEHWLAGLEDLLQSSGLVSAEELQSGKAAGAAPVEAVPASAVAGILERGASTELPAEQPPQFTPGTRVQVRNEHPTGHTRAPRYLRGRTGAIDIHHGAHILPDAHAATATKQAVHLYTVCFDGKELWGSAAEPDTQVRADLFETYLTPA